MLTRPLGKTGESLTVVGFGGIVVMNEEPASASRLVAQAFERGVRYFDVAPTYGNSEECLGPALEPFRKSVFLACKTTDRTKEGSAAELKRSLERLRTDHFDLYQLHGVRSMDDVERITAPGGALETFVAAQRDGRVRHIGFSAHSEEAALALMARCEFASVLYPVNWVTWHQGHFGQRIMDAAHSRGMGILALKSLARGKWPEGAPRSWPKCWYQPVLDKDEASLALRFTLSKPVTAAVSPSHAEFLWWMCDIADQLTPLSAGEEAEVAKRSQGAAPIFPQ